MNYLLIFLYHIYYNDPVKLLADYYGRGLLNYRRLAIMEAAIWKVSDDRLEVTRVESSIIAGDHATEGYLDVSRG